MGDPPEREVLCVSCRGRFKEQEIQGCDCCPRCGTKSTPAYADDIADVRLTWHEIRILAFAAMNWAKYVDNSQPQLQMPRAVQGILGEIRRQHPLAPPLDLEEELVQIREHYPDAKLYDADGNEVPVEAPKKPH